MTPEIVKDLLSKLPPAPKPFYLSDKIMSHMTSRQVNGNVLLAYLKLYGVSIDISASQWLDQGQAVLQGNVLSVSTETYQKLNGTTEPGKLIEPLNIKLFPYSEINNYLFAPLN